MEFADALRCGLRAARTRQGMSREALAEKAGVSADMLAKFEAGYRDASLKTLSALFSALGVEPWEVLAETANAAWYAPLLADLGRLDEPARRAVKALVKGLLDDRGDD